MDRESPNLQFHPSGIVVQVREPSRLRGGCQASGAQPGSGRSIHQGTARRPESCVAAGWNTDAEGATARKRAKGRRDHPSRGNAPASTRRSRKRPEPLNNFGLSNAPSGAEWLFYVLPAKRGDCRLQRGRVQHRFADSLQCCSPGFQECMATQSLRRTQCVATARLHIPRTWTRSA